MSFILDALKKSEAERQRRAGPALLGMQTAGRRRHIPGWVWVAGGALVLINAGLLLWLLVKPAANTSASAPPAAMPAAAAPAVVLSPTPVAPTAVAPGMTIGAATPAAVDDVPADDTNDADRAAAIIADEEPATASRLRHYSDLVGELPALHLDFHVYSPNAAARYAFINMHKVREGDTTAEGMRVLAITHDGVELRYMNREFLLSRE